MPPTPVTYGEEDGKLTASAAIGPLRPMQSLDPVSPEAARTEMPAAVESASSPSTARTPPAPMASASAGSQVPSEAEMTSGTRLPFCSGAVSERSTSEAWLRDS